MSDAREALVALILEHILDEGANECSCRKWEHWEDPYPERIAAYSGHVADAILAEFDVTPRGEGEQPFERDDSCGYCGRVHSDFAACFEDTTVTPPTVKPSVEALADALAAEGIDCAPGDLDLTPTAERLLAMLPGRTEAEVKAEVWDEVADYLDRTNAPSLAEAARRDNPYRQKEADDDR